MTNPLNYQPSNSAVYYTPPSRINIGRTLVGCLIAAVAIVIGSVAYAKLQPLMNTIYVRVAQAVVGAVAVGALAVIPVWFGKVRIPIVAAFIGAGLALLAVYVMWVTWVHDEIGHGIPLGYGTLIEHPIVLFRLIHFINRIGAWTWHHEVVRGFPLAIYWLVSTQSGRRINIRPLVNQLLVTEEEAAELKVLFKQIFDSRETAAVQGAWQAIFEKQSEGSSENALDPSLGDSGTGHEG